MADLPDELVQAAAEALENTSDGGLVVGWGTLAAAALQAAFAKLPECEAAVILVREAAHDSEKCFAPDQCVMRWGADCALAALAREFGGRE